MQGEQIDTMVRRNVANDQRNTDAVRHLREVIRRALKKGGLSKIFGETNEEDIINIMNQEHNEVLSNFNRFWNTRNFQTSDQEARRFSQMTAMYCFYSVTRGRKLKQIKEAFDELKFVTGKVEMGEFPQILKRLVSPDTASPAILMEAMGISEGRSRQVQRNEDNFIFDGKIDFFSDNGTAQARVQQLGNTFYDLLQNTASIQGAEIKNMSVTIYKKRGAGQRMSKILNLSRQQIFALLASAAKSGNPNEYLAKILVFLGHKDFSSKMIDPDEIDFFEYIEGMDDDNDKKKGLMEYLRSIERIEFNISNKNIESISKAYESVKKKRATKANWKQRAQYQRYLHSLMNYVEENFQRSGKDVTGKQLFSNFIKNNELSLSDEACLFEDDLYQQSMAFGIDMDCLMRCIVAHSLKTMEIFEIMEIEASTKANLYDFHYNFAQTVEKQVKNQQILNFDLTLQKYQAVFGTSQQLIKDFFYDLGKKQAKPTYCSWQRGSSVAYFWNNLINTQWKCVNIDITTILSECMEEIMKQKDSLVPKQEEIIEFQRKLKKSDKFCKWQKNILKVVEQKVQLAVKTRKFQLDKVFFIAEQTHHAQLYYLIPFAKMLTSLACRYLISLNIPFKFLPSLTKPCFTAFKYKINEQQELESYQQCIVFDDSDLTLFNPDRRIAKAVIKQDVQNFSQEQNCSKDVDPQYKSDCCIDLENEEFVQKVQQMRQKKFDSYGLAAFDIETFKENVDCVDGNTHPFMLSLYGKLYNYEKGEMVDVDEIFSGFDCSSQFVQYLIINNYFDVKMNANNCRNYIFAHNGGKFDFKFIIKHLFTMLPVQTTEVVGNPQQMKAIKTIGINFYDSLLVITQSLADLAKTFTKEQKFDSDCIKDVNKKQAMRMLAEKDKATYLQVAQYCRQDSRVLYLSMQNFFQRLFIDHLPSEIESIGLYTGQVFFMTAAQIALHVFKQCFLEFPLTVQPELLDIEREAYTGGFTCVFNTNMRLGLSLDINSAYPSVMSTDMPAYHINKTEARKIALYEGYIIATDSQYLQSDIRDLQQKIKSYNLYEVTYQIDEEISCAITRTNNRMSLIEMKSRENVWLPGALLIEMIKQIEIKVQSNRQYQFKLQVTKEIAYTPQKLYKNYVETFYEKRQQAKRDNDTVKSELYKILLNSLYGKHAQKEFPVSKIFDDICDVVEYYRTVKHNLENIHVHVLKSNNMEDQVKELTENSITYPNFYCFEGEHPKGVGNNVGNLVRIATSISAKAKALLIGSYLTIENKLNEEYKMNEKFISYCDTDSIYLDISKIVLVELRKMYDSMDPAVQTKPYYELYIYCVQPKEQDVMNMIQTHKQKIADQFTQWFAQSNLKTVLESIQISSIEEGNTQPLLHNSKLGSFKIEKYIINGVFTAAKQYGVMYVEDNQVKTEIKLKGVSKKARENLYFDLWRQIITYRKVLEVGMNMVEELVKQDDQDENSNTLDAIERYNNDINIVNKLVEEFKKHDLSQACIIVQNDVQFTSKGQSVVIHQQTKVITPTLGKRFVSVQDNKICLSSFFNEDEYNKMRRLLKLINIALRKTIVFQRQDKGVEQRSLMTKNQNQLDKIGKQVVEDLDMHEDFNNQEIEYIWERFPIQLEEATCHIKSTIQIFLERGEQQCIQKKVFVNAIFMYIEAVSNDERLQPSIAAAYCDSHSQYDKKLKAQFEKLAEDLLIPQLWEEYKDLLFLDTMTSSALIQHFIPIITKGIMFINTISRSVGVSVYNIEDLLFWEQKRFTVDINLVRKLLQFAVQQQQINMTVFNRIIQLFYRIRHFRLQNKNIKLHMAYLGKTLSQTESIQHLQLLSRNTGVALNKQDVYFESIYGLVSEHTAAINEVNKSQRKYNRDGQIIADYINNQNTVEQTDIQKIQIDNLIKMSEYYDMEECDYNYNQQQ